MPDVEMVPMDPPSKTALWVDSGLTYQELVGFGGAFTEAAAINWRLLTPDDQAEIIRMYFGDPAEGGHGYTLGRVPINSCDFSPASYDFDSQTGDTELKHFDTNVQHDVDMGMIPMMQAAIAELAKHGANLTLFASPWSPPAWMKQEVDGQRSMTLSAKPNCLEPDLQDTWARYYSKFIEAYKGHGVPIWGVTVQNEPEAAVGWEACLYTAPFMASFVRDHLGPVLEREQPGVKIIGFDHNKDHVLEWATELYKDEAAKKYFAGVGVHWYGGLNTRNLNLTHHLAPDKFILGTEACNCGGVVYQAPSLPHWWARAEALALDVLEDLKYWAVGWTDWNLVLSTDGGPNHLKNLCDANIIVDPDNALGMGKVVTQASYHFMGHFSRFLPPGSKRVKLHDSVAVHTPPLSPDDILNGQALVFEPCDGNAAQRWITGEGGEIQVVGTDTASGSDGYADNRGECIDFAADAPVPKTQTWACWRGSVNQVWNITAVHRDGKSRIENVGLGKCLTVMKGPGSIAGADPGTTVTAAQLLPCLEPGNVDQTFELENFDGGGFPSNFPIRWSTDLCLQPRIERVPHFDAVAFLTPAGSLALVAINIGEAPIDFTLYDERAKVGAEGLTVQPHSIQTYTWHPDAPNKPAEAAAQVAAAAQEAAAMAMAVQEAAAMAAAAQEAMALSQEQTAHEAAARTAAADATAVQAVAYVAARGVQAPAETVTAWAKAPSQTEAPAGLVSAALAAVALALGALSVGLLAHRRARERPEASYRRPFVLREEEEETALGSAGRAAYAPPDLRPNTRLETNSRVSARDSGRA